jgi:hypothetical protein
MMCKNKREFQKYPSKKLLFAVIALKKTQTRKKSTKSRSNEKSKKNCKKAQIIPNEILY